MSARESYDVRSEQILVRVSRETYTALQLAQPFERRRSMQDLVVSIIDAYLDALRSREPGFEQALVGLREAQARESGVLARMTTESARKSRRSPAS